jgi:hypothetical protein
VRQIVMNMQGFSDHEYGFKFIVRVPFYTDISPYREIKKMVGLSEMSKIVANRE